MRFFELLKAREGKKMGAQKTDERVDNAWIEVKKPDRLPLYLGNRFTQLGVSVAVLRSLRQGQETGSTYLVGVKKTRDDVFQPIPGWKEMLRENFIPEEVIALLNDFFGDAPEICL